MKKQIAFGLVGLLCAQISFAASGLETDSTQIKTSTKDNYPSSSVISMITPQLGVISSTVDTPDFSGYKFKEGVSTGVGLDLGHSDFVIETGLIYRQEGAQFEGENDTLKFNLDYLAVPLLAKYYFSGAASSSVYVKGGVTPSILLDAHVTSDFQNEDIHDVNTVVLDGTIGVGGNIKVSSRNSIIVELIYSRGLTSAASDSTVHTSLFGLNVGFGFGM